MTEIDENIIELLDIETARINTPDFVEADPVQFPRRFDKLQDIEITAFLSATIAWGNRKMICSNCEKNVASDGLSALQLRLRRRV